jgi:apolipoprotein N-acyltransferase
MPAFRTRWVLLSILSAVLLSLSFPYPGFAFLAWVALIPLFVVILTEKPGKVFFSSLTTGFLFNIVYLLWMKEYQHPASLPGGIFAEMIFFCFAVLLSWFLSNSVRRLKPLALALSWLSVDYIKTIGFLGFPWGILGYSQYENLPLIQSARSFGVWGVDFLILYANGLVAFLAAGLMTKGFKAAATGHEPLDSVDRGGDERAAGNLTGTRSKVREFSIGELTLSLLMAKTVPLAVFAALLVLSLIYGTVTIRREELLYDTARGKTAGPEAAQSGTAGGGPGVSTGTSGYSTVRVALVQANFDPWSPQIAENLLTEMDLTRRALELNPDLVVWSESSVPFPYEFFLRRNNRYARQVHEFIVSTGKPFLFGTLEFEGDYREGEYEGIFYNAAVFYKDGTLEGTYRKVHLVPFGEWFPFDRIFPFVDTILQAAGAGDFVPGTEYKVFYSGKFRFNVLICFEDVFGELTRRFVAGGLRPGGAATPASSAEVGSPGSSPPPGRSDLIVNVTNDAWTGSRKAQQQHFSISVFRAVENRRGFVRAANGGVTACVSPWGEVIDSLEMFTTGFLVCDVPVAGGERLTFYSRFGDLPVRSVVILVGLSLLIGLLKKVIDRKKKPRIM